MVGVIAHFEAKPGNEDRMQHFFHEGLPVVEQQPKSTKWYAFRINATSYGAFAVFATEADRETLLANGGPQLAKKYADMFAEAPTFEKMDILEAREG